MEEDLLLRYADGLTDEAETTRVEEWLAASDEHRALLRRVQQLLLAADVAANPARLRVEEALRAVHGRMKRRLWKRIGRVVQRVAAVLFLPALGAALWLYAGLMHDDGRMWEARTSPGMNATVVLPDSSVVVLNSSSVLRYPERFRGDTRQVSLSGEAYFSVQHDPDRRFIVQTPHQGQVEVRCFEQLYLTFDEVLKILASESGGIELASLAVKLIAERALHRSCRDFVRNSRILETATAELEKVSRTMKTGQMPFSKYVETNQDVDEALQKRLSLIDAMGKQLLDTLGKI